MSSENTLTLVCKKCGKEITIPSDLQEFACMYCGEKMTIADFASDDPENMVEKIIPCVTEHRKRMEYFTKADYADSFIEYENLCRDIFFRLNANITANVALKNEIISKTAKLFMDDLTANWEADPRWKKKMSRSVIMDEDKMFIVIYLVPMIVHLGLTYSRDIAEGINKEWMERFPKSPFYIGTFEEISGGFRKKFLGLCFITTAVCEADGKPDDCMELETLRAFRDGYLRSQPDGDELINEYYDVAPVIVTLINHMGNSEAKYAELRDKYILPCVDDAIAGRNELCRDRYVQMMRQLEREYMLKS